jgi:hypothetical protein
VRSRGSGAPAKCLVMVCKRDAEMMWQPEMDGKPRVGLEHVA